jgi:hypothetical protein
VPDNLLIGQSEFNFQAVAKIGLTFSIFVSSTFILIYIPDSHVIRMEGAEPSVETL